MNTITLWTGLPGSGRHVALYERFESELRRGTGIWLVVASKRRAEIVERELAERFGAVAGLEVIVAGNLPGHCIESSGVHPETVAVEVRELLLRELMNETDIAKAQGELSPGWARHIAELLVRMNTETEEERGVLVYRLRQRYPWAWETLQRYQERIGNAGLIDESSLPSVAVESLAFGRCRTPNLLVVDRVGPLPPAIGNVIHRLADATEKTIVLIDSSASESPALALAKQNLKRWRVEHEVEEIPFIAPPLNRSICDTLFTPEPFTGEHGHIPLFASYHVDKAREVRFVAGEVARLLYDETVDEKDIAVVCTSLDEYASQIEQLFPRFGVAIDLRLGQPMSTSPVARLILTLLELRCHGLSRENITDLLLNPYATWGEQLAKESNVLFFDTAAREARIADGRGSVGDAWLEPMRALAAQWRRLADHLGDSDADPLMVERRQKKLREEAALLEMLLQEFEALAGALLELPDECGVDEVLGWLESMIERLGVRNKVHRAARHDVNRGERDVRVLGRLKVSLDHVATALRLQGADRWPVQRFEELLRLGLATTPLPPGGRLRGGVPVLGPLEIRGLRVKHLFFVGLTTRLWPRSPGLDITDPHLAKWLAIDQLAESRALTMEAMFAGERVHFSAPCLADGEAEETPSPILKELEEGLPVIHESERQDELRSALDLLPELGYDLNNGLRSRARARWGRVSGLRSGDARWNRVWNTMEVEEVRSDPATITPYDGWVDGPMREWLAERSFRKPLSPTRLDRYAKCPMQYLLGNVLHIEPLEEVDDEIDARTVGTIVHNVLAETARSLRREQGGMAGDFSRDVERTKQLMHEHLQRELEPYTWDNLFWEDIVENLVSGLDDPEKPLGILGCVALHHEEKLEGEAVVLAEASFGLPSDGSDELILKNPLKITVDETTVELAGRIDRVSLHPKKGWRVWDYKVTKKKKTISSKSKMEKGVSFQLPVYFWALEEWQDQGHGTDKTIDAAKYYVIARNGELPSMSRDLSYKNFKLMDEELRHKIVSIRRAIEAGRYHHPLLQDSDLCPVDYDHNYCPFKDICRRDHGLWSLRPGRLNAGALEKAYLINREKFVNADWEGLQ